MSVSLRITLILIIAAKIVTMIKIWLIVHP